MTGDRDSILAEQADYYRARAPEYDEWWQRSGRYDRGGEATADWHTEVAEVEAALAAADLTGDVLELACGTGWWTERLARRARSLTCIDASPETIAINRDRLTKAGLPLPVYRVADLFAWRPDAAYDAVFFSFWLSHVPDEEFETFWSAVAASLRPGGRVFLIDSAPDPTSTAHDHAMPGPNGIQARRLNDGRGYRIVKHFHDPAALTAMLAGLEWTATIEQTRRYFIYGQAVRAKGEIADKVFYKAVN